MQKPECLLHPRVSDRGVKVGRSHQQKERVRSVASLAQAGERDDAGRWKPVTLGGAVAKGVDIEANNTSKRWITRVCRLPDGLTVRAPGLNTAIVLDCVWQWIAAFSDRMA